MATRTITDYNTVTTAALTDEILIYQSGTYKLTTNHIIDNIYNLTGKTTPIDADSIPITDSEASYVAKKLTFANLKTFITTALGAMINSATGKTTPVNADLMVITDTEDSNSTKKVTFTNFKAFLKTYFDSIYASVSAPLTSDGFGSFISGLTEKTIAVDDDVLSLSDSADTDDTKAFKWSSLISSLEGTSLNFTGDNTITGTYAIGTTEVKGSQGVVHILQGTTPGDTNWLGSSPLVVERSGACYVNLRTSNTGSVGVNFSDPDATSSGGLFFFHNGDYITLNILGTEKLRVNSTGVMIGTATNPSNPFHVQSTTIPQVRIAYDGSNYLTIGVSSGGVATLTATGSLALGSSISSAVSITNTTASTSSTTGALIVGSGGSGGLGVAGNVVNGGYLKSGKGRWPTGSYETSSGTENTIFDALDTYIPNTNDEILLTGGMARNVATNDILYIVNRAVRTGASTIEIYYVALNLSPSLARGSITMTNGGSTAWTYVSISW